MAPLHKSARKQSSLLAKEKTVSYETVFSLRFCAARGNRGQVSKYNCSFHSNSTKNFLPGLGDKPSLRSSCVPPPSFDSLWLLPTAKARKVFTFRACCLVRLVGKTHEHVGTMSLMVTQQEVFVQNVSQIVTKRSKHGCTNTENRYIRQSYLMSGSIKCHRKLIKITEINHNKKPSR